MAGETGLQQDSIAMAHQIRAIMKTRLGQQCGQITQQSVKHAVEQAMRVYLDL